jgi:sugar phosphate isomerase/epimerase
MARFGLATLNHSPLHGLATEMTTHLDATKAAGFDALAPDIFWLRALEAEGVALEELAEAMQERGLSCMEIAGIAIGSQERTQAELEENLRYARVLGAEFVNARVIAPTDEIVLEGLRRCADALADVGARVALEFTNGTGLPDLRAACAFIERAEAPGVGVTLDTWHFIQSEGGADWKGLEELPLEALANVQLSDGVAFATDNYGEETMNHRRLPGAGDFDLPRIARCLEKKGFDGAVIVEVLSASLREWALPEFANEAGRTTRNWWTD